MFVCVVVRWELSCLCSHFHSDKWQTCLVFISPIKFLKNYKQVYLLTLKNVEDQGQVPCGRSVCLRMQSQNWRPTVNIGQKVAQCRLSLAWGKSFLPNVENVIILAQCWQFFSFSVFFLFLIPYLRQIWKTVAALHSVCVYVCVPRFI